MALDGCWTTVILNWAVLLVGSLTALPLSAVRDRNIANGSHTAHPTNLDVQNANDPDNIILPVGRNLTTLTGGKEEPLVNFGPNHSKLFDKHIHINLAGYQLEPKSAQNVKNLERSPELSDFATIKDASPNTTLTTKIKADLSETFTKTDIMENGLNDIERPEMALAHQVVKVKDEPRSLFKRDLNEHTGHILHADLPVMHEVSLSAPQHHLSGDPYPHFPQLDEIHSEESRTTTSVDPANQENHDAPLDKHEEDSAGSDTPPAELRRSAAPGTHLAQTLLPGTQRQTATQVTFSAQQNPLTDTAPLPRHLPALEGPPGLIIQPDIKADSPAVFSLADGARYFVPPLALPTAANSAPPWNTHHDQVLHSPYDGHVFQALPEKLLLSNYLTSTLPYLYVNPPDNPTHTRKVIDDARLMSTKNAADNTPVVNSSADETFTPLPDFTNQDSEFDSRLDRHPTPKRDRNKPGLLVSRSAKTAIQRHRITKKKHFNTKKRLLGVKTGRQSWHRYPEGHSRQQQHAVKSKRKTMPGKAKPGSKSTEWPKRRVWYPFLHLHDPNISSAKNYQPSFMKRLANNSSYTMQHKGPVAFIYNRKVKIVRKDRRFLFHPFLGNKNNMTGISRNLHKQEIHTKIKTSDCDIVYKTRRFACRLSDEITGLGNFLPWRKPHNCLFISKHANDNYGCCIKLLMNKLKNNVHVHPKVKFALLQTYTSNHTYTFHCCRRTKGTRILEINTEVAREAIKFKINCVQNSIRVDGLLKFIKRKASNVILGCKVLRHSITRKVSVSVYSKGDKLFKIFLRKKRCPWRNSWSDRESRQPSMRGKDRNFGKHVTFVWRLRGRYRGVIKPALTNAAMLPSHVFHSNASQVLRFKKGKQCENRTESTNLVSKRSSVRRRYKMKRRHALTDQAAAHGRSTTGLEIGHLRPWTQRKKPELGHGLSSEYISTAEPLASRPKRPEDRAPSLDKTDSSGNNRFQGHSLGRSVVRNASRHNYPVPQHVHHRREISTKRKAHTKIQKNVVKRNRLTTILLMETSPTRHIALTARKISNKKTGKS